jgi:hypothetical protein
MIKDRPTHLLNQADYKKLPEKPFGVDFDALPELVRKSFGPLGGIQPVTGAMFKAANGVLRDMPSEGEVELFTKAETRFQPIFAVMNVAHLETEGAAPNRLSLRPNAYPGFKAGRDRCENDRSCGKARRAESYP